MPTHTIEPVPKPGGSRPRFPPQFSAESARTHWPPRPSDPYIPPYRRRPAPPESGESRTHAIEDQAWPTGASRPPG